MEVNALTLSCNYNELLLICTFQMTGPPMYTSHPQPQMVVVQGGFDAGARFDSNAKPTIPVSSIRQCLGEFPDKLQFIGRRFMSYFQRMHQCGTHL